MSWNSLEKHGNGMAMVWHELSLQVRHGMERKGMEMAWNGKECKSHGNVMA